MAPTLYELAGAQDERFSPYCWRVRFALAHKGLKPEVKPLAYHQIRAVGDGSHPTVPILVDDSKEVCDSWAIASHLEEAYPEKPALFGPGARRMGQYKFIEAWTNQVLHPAIMPLIVLDIFERLQPEDQAYFRETREKRFGSLEAARGDETARREMIKTQLAPVRFALSRQKWLGGDSPDYADYIVAGTLQWPRVSSPRRVVEDPAVEEWFERMLDLFDGMGRKAPALR